MILKSDAISPKIYSFCKSLKSDATSLKKNLLILKSDAISLKIYSCCTNSQVRCYLSEEKFINPKV